jgi:hypothetical protein
MSGSTVFADAAESGENLLQLSWALNFVADQASCQFARLRFLVEGNFGDIALAPLGERLLSIDADDLDVRRRLAILLASSDVSKQRDKGLRIALNTVAEQPSNPRFVGMMASVYFGRYKRSMRRRDAEQFLVWNQNYLALVPSSSRSAIEARYAAKTVSDLLAKRNE